MKRLLSSVLVLIAASPLASSAALGKTVTTTINESASVVPGNSVSAYVIHDELVTAIADNENPISIPLHGILPVMEVTFPLQRGWILVKHVRWNKRSHRLIIDF